MKDIPFICILVLIFSVLIMVFVIRNKIIELDDTPVYEMIENTTVVEEESK